MNILAIDTSGEILSLALYQDGKIISLDVNSAQNQASVLYAQLNKLFAKANTDLDSCDAIAFGKGPGSFTGVRIAAACVQGLAIAKNIPVIPISNLQALAYQAWRANINAKADFVVLSAVDARMEEVYTAWYKISVGGEMHLLQEEQLGTPENLTCPTDETGKFIMIGNADEYLLKMPLAFREQIEQTITTPVKASAIAKLGADYFLQNGGLSPENALPIYLREAVL